MLRLTVMWGKQVELLEHHAHFFAHVAQMLFAGRNQLIVAQFMPQGPAGYIYDPFVNGFQGHEYAQARGFTRAGWAANGDFLAFFHVEVPAVQHSPVTKALHHLVELTAGAGFWGAWSSSEVRSAEHTSELHSLMRILYAVF